MTKRCTKFGKEKDLNFFGTDSKKKDGKRCACKECEKGIYREYRKKYHIKNRKKIIARVNIHVAKNKGKIKIYKKNHHAEMMKNPCYRILHNYNNRIVKALKGAFRIDSTKNIIGCTPENLKKYLESQFRDGMSWDNYGFLGWHIDHIKPCSSFDLTDPEQQRACFHYSNLQPLWCDEHMEKRKSDFKVVV